MQTVSNPKWKHDLYELIITLEAFRKVSPSSLHATMIGFVFWMRISDRSAWYGAFPTATFMIWKLMLCIVMYAY